MWFRLTDRVTAAWQKEPRTEPTLFIQVNCCPLLSRLPLLTLCWVQQIWMVRLEAREATLGRRCRGWYEVLRAWQPRFRPKVLTCANTLTPSFLSSLLTGSVDETQGQWFSLKCSYFCLFFCFVSLHVLPSFNGFDRYFLCTRLCLSLSPTTYTRSAALTNEIASCNCAAGGRGQDCMSQVVCSQSVSAVQSITEQLDTIKDWGKREPVVIQYHKVPKWTKDRVARLSILHYKM